MRRQCWRSPRHKSIPTSRSARKRPIATGPSSACPRSRNPDSVEIFAAAAAQADTQSGVPHGYYRSHDPGFGAENEAPNWYLPFYGSAHNLTAQAIATFWSEGPGGGHYENIVGPFSQIGCGFFQKGSDLTVVQDFR